MPRPDDSVPPEVTEIMAKLIEQSLRQKRCEMCGERAEPDKEGKCPKEGECPKTENKEDSEGKVSALRRRLAMRRRIRERHAAQKKEEKKAAGKDRIAEIRERIAERRKEIADRKKRQSSTTADKLRRLSRLALS